jgi:hypothetical protein
MRSARVWLCAAFVTAALAGASLLTATMSSVGVAAEARAPKASWHYHDGRWSYWDEGDHRWYYTDGSHWFFDDNDHWKVYQFDKGFGREGFERGDYKIPREVERVVVPAHKHPR